jgi:hypothetical protein
MNVSGVNGVALKALSTGAVSPTVTSTGTINVAGGADPSSGTRNFGVWAEGQGTGTARANVQGPVNLLGDGAIGIHARGRATVTVAAGAVPAFTSGSKQIGFFAFGNDAHINVNGGSNLDVSTAQSTLFRLDSGADFDGTGAVHRGPRQWCRIGAEYAQCQHHRLRRCCPGRCRRRRIRGHDRCGDDDVADRRGRDRRYRRRPEA